MRIGSIRTSKPALSEDKTASIMDIAGWQLMVHSVMKPALFPAASSISQTVHTAHIPLLLFHTNAFGLPSKYC